MVAEAGRQPVELEGHAGQSGAQAVMEVVADAPPLLLPGQDEPFPAPLEIRGQPYGMDGCRQPAGQVVEELLLLGALSVRVT